MTLNVADISRYQDTSVIPALRGGGTNAIIVGVTFGCAGNNPIYSQQLAATALNGMLRGAYHIRARVNWTPQQEADFFLAHMAGYLDGRTVLVLDWEECDTSDEAWALAWLQYVEAKTGIKPWFYVNLSDLLTYKYPSIAANGNAIWLAQYPYSSVNGFAGVNWQPQAIPVGHTLVAWQYVGTGGTVNGIGQLDLSVAYINTDGWLAYASSTSTQSGTITPIQEELVPNQSDKVFDAIDGSTVSLNELLNSIDRKATAAVSTAQQALAAVQGIWSVQATDPTDPKKSYRAIDYVVSAATRGRTNAEAIARIPTTAPAAPPLDVQALAAELAPLLTTNQAHQFIVALGQALPKE